MYAVSWLQRIVEKYRFRTIVCRALTESRSGITDFRYVAESVLVST